MIVDVKTTSFSGEEMLWNAGGLVPGLSASVITYPGEQNIGGLLLLNSGNSPVKVRISPFVQTGGHALFDITKFKITEADAPSSPPAGLARTGTPGRVVDNRWISGTEFLGSTVFITTMPAGTYDFYLVNCTLPSDTPLEMGGITEEWAVYWEATQPGNPGFTP